MRAGYLMHRYPTGSSGRGCPQSHSADGAEMGKLMVAEGLGVSLLPDYSVIDDPLERAGLIIPRPIAGDATRVTMTLLHRRTTSTPEAVRSVVAAFRDVAGVAETA